MVNVQDNVHIVINAVVYNFFYSCKPLRVDSEVVAGRVVAPRYRYSDRVEALLLYSVYHCFSCFRVAPRCFAVQAVSSSCCIKSVAEIPACTHLGCDLFCCFACYRSSRGTRCCTYHKYCSCKYCNKCRNNRKGFLCYCHFSPCLGIITFR